MERMTGQTKIIVATACCLALVDIAVRTLTPAPVSGNGVVTARAVRLVDGNGNVRGLWNTDEQGEPALWMYDRNGATRIELDTTENIPSLSLHDPDGNRRVYVGMNKNDGSGLFTMMEPDAKTARFVLDGSDLTPNYKLSDDGSFTQTPVMSEELLRLQYEATRAEEKRERDRDFITRDDQDPHPPR